MSESAPVQGDADSSTDCGTKESSVECPTCGRADFKSERGLKLHHKKAHGESIAGVVITCHQCGDQERKRATAKESERNFCGTDCRNEWLQSQSGQDHPQSSERVSVTCHYCGETDRVKPSRAELSERYFCSQDCYGSCIEETGETRGEENPRWTQKEVECSYCGEEKSLPKHRIESQEYYFCTDKDCHSEWLSQNNSGADNPNYDPDSISAYGPNWDEQAEKCRARDGYRCQSCGKRQQDNFRALTAHHIVPRKEFVDDSGVYDYELGNRLENLVTLCDACHHRWEGVPVKPTLVTSD